MKVLGQIFSVILVKIYQMFFYGFVFMKLYNWFIPKAFNVGEIQLALAIGLLLVASFLKYKYVDDEDKDKDFSYKLLKAMLIVTIIAPMFLLLGYIVHLFM